MIFDVDMIFYIFRVFMNFFFVERKCPEINPYPGHIVRFSKTIITIKFYNFFTWLLYLTTLFESQRSSEKTAHHYLSDLKTQVLNIVLNTFWYQNKAHTRLYSMNQKAFYNSIPIRSYEGFHFFPQLFWRFYGKVTLKKDLEKKPLKTPKKKKVSASKKKHMIL